MSETAEFDLGDVLSVTGNRLVSPDGITGVYRICNWLAGESLYTHQLIRAHDVFKPELLRQHPELTEVDDSPVTSENWRTWLKEQKARYGSEADLDSIQRLCQQHGLVFPPLRRSVELAGGDEGSQRSACSD